MKGEELKQKRWVSGAMSAGVTAGTGELGVDFRGLVTPAGLKTFCKEAPGWLPAVHSVLFRFDRATVAVDANTFTGLCEDLAVRRLLRPGAIVCKPSDLRVFQEHARQAVGLGVIRVPFTDVEKAAAWARELADAARLEVLAGMQGHHRLIVPAG